MLISSWAAKSRKIPNTIERHSNPAKKAPVNTMAGIWSTFVLSSTQTSAASSTHITKLCVNSDLVACFSADSLMKERGSSMPEFRRRTRMVARPPIRIE